ncbi:MAG: hypothetical protein R3324_10040, partial [Halobacteriales archaeon]|nr:hypothetical protein [Halobacteriales archaeon]
PSTCLNSPTFRVTSCSPLDWAVAVVECSDVSTLGTGDAHSFNTVVDRSNDELGTDVQPTDVDYPIAESVYVHDTCADPSKVHAATGWDPEIPFGEGIRRVCA